MANAPCISSRRGARALALAALGLASCAWQSPVHAQLRLPQLNLPTPSTLPQRPLQALPEVLSSTVPLQDLRTNTVRDLLRRNPDTIEADPRGEPMRRSELVLVSPSPATVDAAVRSGFIVLREQTLGALDLHHVIVRVPPGVGTADALTRLRAIDPQLQVDFNHLYTRSADAPSARVDAVASPTEGGRRVGLIDSGIDRGHRALRAAHVQTWGCNGGERPSPHGTAVASLLVGRDAAFTGVAPESALLAADVYCEQAAGGAVDDIVQAMAWLARERVAVINISLVGPPNRVLEQAVQTLIKRGHLLVAAVGNDGPAAPPLYPASYAGVVGVTGVLPTRRVLPEAAQGPQVMFAAPGAELAVARAGGGYLSARGTSYAAPVVAGLLAQWLSMPEPTAAAAALARLAAAAQDLGPPGRDPVYGLGLVGEGARVAPERVQARAR
jgi:hypothetical protein